MWRGADLVLGFLLLTASGQAVHGAEGSSGDKPDRATANQTKDQIVLYYFCSFGCGPCKDPETIRSVERIKELLTKSHPDLSCKFVLIYLENDLKEAAEFARGYGRWDEISTGTGWQNELAQHYAVEAKNIWTPTCSCSAIGLKLGKIATISKSGFLSATIPC